MEDDPAHNSNHGTKTSDPIDDRSDAAPKACCHKMGSRNLIVCIDGTSNQFGKKNTNVIELYNLILKELSDNQRTWYNSGIGTYARPSWKSWKFYKQVLVHKIDLAIAWDFERTILGAYRWLSDNYEKGDCIFLFGFSRGAFQVRALSAMIDKVGLIYKGNEMQIPFAYELYADPRHDTDTLTQVGSQQQMSMAERFKSVFSHKDVKVHFVGAWDTVSSIGIIRSKHMLPGTVEGMTHVCYFRHALALDERRVKFLPEYAYGGVALKTDGISDELVAPYWGSSMTLLGLVLSLIMTPVVTGLIANALITRLIISALFTGLIIFRIFKVFQEVKATSEKNVSTLNKDNTPPTDNQDVIDKTSANGPSTKLVDIVDRSEVKSGKGSMGKHAHTLEVWFAGTHSDIGGGNVENVGMDRSRPPLRWMVFEAGALGLRMTQFERELSFEEQVEIKESLTWWWWPLEVLPFNRPTYMMGVGGKPTTYKPHLGSSRKIHHGQKIHGSLLLTNKTDDQYTPKAKPVDNIHLFWQTLRNGGLGEWLERDMYENTKIIMEGFIAAKCRGNKLHILGQIAMSRDGRQAVYEKVVEALEKHLQLEPEQLEPEIKDRLLYSTMNILRKGSQDDSQLKLSPSSKIRPLVSDLWKSSNQDYKEIAREFVMQFADTSPLVLDVNTSVMSVTFSPDGRHVVSGSNDKTVRMWDAEKGKPVGEPFHGHRDLVTSVAFSPDGRRVVSGSNDKTLRIWDTETGKQVGEPFQGHTDWVTTVVFLGGGGGVVSGSEGSTVRIWATETGKPVGEPLQGHTRSVTSVALSPDGRRLVSGSNDKTVRIWDVEKGKPVGEPFQGHTDWITSVAFSPDGRRLVSGSHDKTVCIWDAETGKPVGEPLRGHTDWVRSVAFSPDGRSVVSGSCDKTVRIWDVETGKPVGEPFRGHTDWVVSVAFSPDSRCVVSGSFDKTIRIWDA